MHASATSTEGQQHLSSDAPLLASTSPRPVWVEPEIGSGGGRMAFSRSRLMVPLWISLGLLVVDAAIEMALVSSMVFYLQHSGKGPFDVVSPSSSTGGFLMFGHPAHLIGNHGHTTNGAGGTAVVLIGFGGLIALWRESRTRRKNGRSSKIFAFWVLLTVLSVLLTLGALIYTFIVTNQTKNQSIDTSLAATLSPTTPYPRLNWTPENWYGAVLDLKLKADTDRSKIVHQFNLMVGWRWNLIPMFLLGLLVSGLALAELKSARSSRGSYAQAPSKGATEYSGASGPYSSK